MRIAVGWGLRDRGLLVGLIVGAVTLGSASPHLIAVLGGADWRATVLATSMLAALGGLGGAGRGPRPWPRPRHRVRSGRLPSRLDGPRIRSVYFGYFGHMWELFAFWAWIAAASAVSDRATLGTDPANARAS